MKNAKFMVSLLLIISLLSSSVTATTVFAVNKEKLEIIQITQEEPDKQEPKNSKKYNTWNCFKSISKRIAIDTAEVVALVTATFMYTKYQLQHLHKESVADQLNEFLAENPGEDIPFLSRYFTYPGNLGEIKQQTVQILNENFPLILNITSDMLNDKFKKLGLSEKKDFMDHCFNEFSSKISKRDRAKVIYDWIGSNIEYDYNAINMSPKEQILELFATYQKASKAEDVFQGKKGICGGISDLTFWMMGSAKVPCAMISSLPTNGLAGAGHAFNAIFIEDAFGRSKWALTDATWGGNFHFPSNLIDESNNRISNENFHTIDCADNSDFLFYITAACKAKFIGTLILTGIFSEILNLKYHLREKIEKKIASNVMKVYKKLTSIGNFKKLKKKEPELKPALSLCK
ncbi:MAG: hypothetical protein RUMPE_01251 [Eubacteriales bacterium SKADARSKE-1]|nr:hypothetical protein [Eubacteriales bacterium SKADARSKE-1]